MKSTKTRMSGDIGPKRKPTMKAGRTESKEGKAEAGRLISEAINEPLEKRMLAVSKKSLVTTNHPRRLAGRRYSFLTMTLLDLLPELKKTATTARRRICRALSFLRGPGPLPGLAEEGTTGNFWCRGCGEARGRDSITSGPGRPELPGGLRTPGGPAFLSGPGHHQWTTTGATWTPRAGHHAGGHLDEIGPGPSCRLSKDPGGSGGD